MAWFQSEQTQQLAHGAVQEITLSRQEIGEHNFPLLQEALSRAIRGMKIGKPSEKDVKLLFQGRGWVECSVRVWCKEETNRVGDKRSIIHTSLFEKGRKNPIGRRTYTIDHYPTEVRIHSNMEVGFGYEGHRIGSALIHATDEVVERFLTLAKKEVEGKRVEMKIEDEAYAQDSLHLNRNNWTSVQADRMGFAPQTDNTYVKRYR
ncbi:MAG TPA: hypothetical protein VJ246_02955 [Patescibacteria group bacterium]|nr:hypothetical protein [Patescibacteria group bacterium]